ncbi:MAG TPA: heme-binding protein, partial [Longimicrobium sp.]|nr:heme-binding protein [Longimicrobium sp.]
GAPKTGAPPAPFTENLGPLAKFPGTWTGTGFNMIWRPLHDPKFPKQGHFLELNLIEETMQIDRIQGAIPNRGLLQPDIFMAGVHYLQQIKDANTGEGLHFEPGIWLTIPQTIQPREPETVARLASIPHGTAMLAQGTSFEFPGPPQFEEVSITPFVVDNTSEKVRFPESNLKLESDFRSPPKNIKGITQKMVDNPNSVLEDAIAGLNITHTTVLQITSAPNPIAGGGTANTAFLQGVPSGAANADAPLVTSTFWINEVKGKKGKPDFLQMQYTQTVILNFNGLSWPHVSVATLRRESKNP